MPPGDGASQVQAPYPMRPAASFVAARISSWEPMMSDFVLLDGAIKINELVKKAKALGMPATAITDHGNLFGTSYFYAACKEMGIAPIIGCEAYVTPDHFDKASELAKVRHHLILLACDSVGYANLMRLVSLNYLEGFYYKPRIDKKMLHGHTDGIVALSALPGRYLAPCAAITS